MSDWDQVARFRRGIQEALEINKRVRELGLDGPTAKVYQELSAGSSWRLEYSNPAYWKSLRELTTALQQQAIALPVARHLKSFSRSAYLAGSALQGVELTEIGPRLHLPARATTAFAEAVEAHSRAFVDLVAEVGNDPPHDERLAELTDQASASIFTEVEMVRTLAGREGDSDTQEERQERRIQLAVSFTDALTGLLAQFGDHYVRNWQGAKQALHGDNPDKARHVLASLRTLWDDLVNVIAPEKEVRKEASEQDYVDTPDGRRVLKREVRFRYIGRKIIFQRLATAWTSDAEALVKVYGMLNGLHTGDLEIPDAELELIVLRTESALLMMIRASELRQG